MPEDVGVYFARFQTSNYRCAPNRRAWGTLAKRKPREELEEVRRVNPLGKRSRIASETPNEQLNTSLVRLLDVTPESRTQSTVTTRRLARQAHKGRYQLAVFLFSS